MLTIPNILTFSVKNKQKRHFYIKSYSWTLVCNAGHIAEINIQKLKYLKTGKRKTEATRLIWELLLIGLFARKALCDKNGILDILRTKVNTILV